MGIGFRYRLNAGEGGRSVGTGRRSSVNSGEKEKRDRVKKSSDWTDGLAKLETVWAADLRARKEAVRLDLKVNPSFGNDRPRPVELASLESNNSSGISSTVEEVVGRRG